MIESGFFNSVNGDRKYNEKFFRLFFGTLIGNGIFPNPSTNLQVYESSNMTVTVKLGKGWINGYFIASDSDYNLTLDTADGVLNRIDRIVMRLDYTDRKIDIEVKKGTFASSPVAPVLQRDADAYELALADIYIGKGVTAITQANITDQRLNSTVCGIVKGLITEVDTTTIFNQYQAWFNQITGNTQSEIDTWQAQQEQAFNDWFATVQNTLSGDVAGNLASQITTVQQDLAAHKTDELYQTVGGTATAITLNINGPLVNGYPMTFIASANNNGSTTTLNSKPLYKPNTTTAPTLIAGKAYSVWYNQSSDCFFIKASAEGNATVAQVLAGATFSNDNDNGLVGTMPNNGAFNLGLGVNVPPGYYSGGTTADGRKFAKVTINSSSSQLPFIDRTGSTSNMNYIQVTGLSFKPVTILLFFTDNILTTVYGDEANTQISGYKQITLVGNTYSYRLTGNAKINNDGFLLPVGASNNISFTAYIFG